MKHVLTTMSFLVIMISISACSNYYVDVAKSVKKKETKIIKFHGDAIVTRDVISYKPTVEALKNNNLNGYSQKNIGEAFDAYSKVSTKEWLEDVGKDGKVYVDYICWFKSKSFLQAVRSDGVMRTGLDVKFVIEKDGDTYIALASKLLMKNDGKIQKEVIPFPEIPKIVDAIYNNKELFFE